MVNKTDEYSLIGPISSSSSSSSSNLSSLQTSTCTVLFPRLGDKPITQIIIAADETVFRRLPDRRTLRALTFCR